MKKLSDDVGKREHRDLSEVDRKDGPTPVFETTQILFRASVSWLSVYRKLNKLWLDLRGLRPNSESSSK